MKKWVALATLAAALVAALFLVPALLPRPDDRLPRATGLRLWESRSYPFLAGVNYPWKSYQDFGTGAWGHSGVSSRGVYDEIDTDFANIAATGVQVVKWRVFNDARYSPEFGDDGTVLGYDDKFLEDVDAALEIASRHNLYLVFSLFDSGLWTTGCDLDGVQVGGHADVMTDPAKRRALIEKAIVPLVRHVAPRGRVVAFELLAEPEWGITELHTEQDGRQTVPLADVRAFVKDATAAIHRHGGGLATVESNRATNMRNWTGLGLDYYSFSWYDWVQPYDPLDVSATSYGLDRPIVLGEYPLQESAYYDFPQTLEIAFGQGYAGAFAWSYSGSDSYGSLRAVRDSYATWLADHWQMADVTGGKIKAPSSSVEVLPPPFSYQNVRASTEGEDVSVDVDLAAREGGSFRVQFYLYPFGEKPADPVADRTLSLRSGAQGTLHLRLPRLMEGKLYRLSMAIFDDSWTMRKWFDSMTIFSVEGGQITRPNLSNLELENPCARPSDE